MSLILSAVLAPVLALAIQSAPTAAWTWTLYDAAAPLVLAQEVPDTPRLRTTLECQPGSGAVAVSLYDHEGGAGFARLSSGNATAASEATLGRGDKLDTTVRADHPVFAAFVASGRLSIAVGDEEDRVVVERPHLAKLRRFADLCSG